MAQSAAIEGAWGTRFGDSTFSIDVTFEISKNSLRMTNVCSVNGQSASVQVVVPSSYTDTTISFLESREASVSSPVECNVSVDAGSVNYSVQGNQLVLSQSGSPDPLVLNRK